MIIKRALVYTAFLAASALLYISMQQLVEFVFVNGTDQHNTIVAVLATAVVVLLAQPVKEALQNALDRVFYRDRYDYRRALVAFARPEQRPRRRPAQPAPGLTDRRDARARSDGVDARRRAPW